MRTSGRLVMIRAHASAALPPDLLV
jgi:hypothetical protein